MHLARHFWIPLVLSLALAGSAAAQEEAHYEGYSMGSNPSQPGTPFLARGLVTALYSPLAYNPAGNEYTWVIDGVFSLGSVLKDSVYYTNYLVGNASSITLYEDPSKDATPTYPMCPADIVGLDPRYSDGTIYLRGHFTQYSASFDIHTATYGLGSYTARLNWDSGAHIADLPGGKRGGWTFGGITNSAWACLPSPTPGAPPYDQALTGRVFQTTTLTSNSTWGRVRQAYR